MSRPRVCVVSHELAPFYGAGISVHANQLARALRDVGCAVHVVTGLHPDLRSRDVPELRGIHIHSVNVDHARAAIADEKPTIAPTWNDIYARAVAEALELLTMEAPFDLIEYPEFGGEGALIGMWRASGRIRARTLVVRLHTPLQMCMELNHEQPLPRVHIPVFRLELQSILLADAVVSPSIALLDLVRQRFGSSPRWPRVERVIPNPFNGDSFISTRQTHRVFEHPTVLYVGRLEWRKGVDTLIRAWSRVAIHRKSAKLLIIGADTQTAPTSGTRFHSSSMRTYLNALVKSFDLTSSVRFMGQVDRASLGPMVLGAEALCLPSRFENFPTVVLEALSAGTPVVAANNGGQAEIIEHGITGLLFPPEDEEQLAQALIHALSEATLSTSTQTHGPARIAVLCDPDSIAHQMLQLVESTDDTLLPDPFTADTNAHPSL